MQNKNEKMIGTNCKKNSILERFWKGFWEDLGRFVGYKSKSKKKFENEELGG